MVVRRISNDELYHHGVKGQRWGVRRYQNADGSLTPEGRKKYRNIKKFNKAKNKQIKSFNKEMNTGPGFSLALYNRSADYFNKGINQINEKHTGDMGDMFETPAGQKYVKEVDAFHKKCMKRALNDMANKYELLGTEYLKESGIKAENLYGYRAYESYIKNKEK